MTEPTMIRAKGDGVELQLALWGGDGSQILCVHGLTANCRCWDAMVSGLSPQHKILAYDLRGRGLSDKPSHGYSEEHHLRDLLCLLDDLDLERVVLMGHSLGGYIAMGFASRHPERVEKLILLDAGGDLPQEHWDRVDTAIKPALDRLEMTFPSVDVFLNLMKQAPFLQPWSDEIEAYFRYDLMDVPEGVGSRIRLSNIHEEMANKRQTGVSQYYKGLTCPVLILRATDAIFSPDDILLPKDAVAKMLQEISDAICVDVENTNHYGIIFQPHPARDQAILDFL